MLRTLRLLLNFALGALLVDYFAVVLIVLLNPAVAPGDAGLLRMGLQLLPFYGSLGLLLMALVYLLTQFFAARRFAIGLLAPPTPLYFAGLAAALATAALYANHRHYRLFLAPDANRRYLLVLALVAALLLSCLVMIALRRRRRRWPAPLVALLLVAAVGGSWLLLRRPLPPAATPAAVSSSPLLNTPRKLRIVLMDGLSLEFLLTLSLDQKLPNFSWIRDNGVMARIRGFRPGYDLALLNTLLSGQPPSAFARHAATLFRVPGLDLEFDIPPRHIFLRNASRTGSAYFYPDRRAAHVDRLRELYAAGGLETRTLLTTETAPLFSRRQLQVNNTFIQLFADVLKKPDDKLRALERAFFYDDFLRRQIPDMRSGASRYSLVRLNGLDKVTRSFYHFARPDMFGRIPPEQIAQYGWVLERYYQYYDAIVGGLIAAMGDDELLVLLALNEPEPLPLWRRILVNYLEDEEVYVYKPTQPVGLALMYEKSALRKGLFLESASLYDLFPTLVYYAGFPLTKNLTGDVLRDIFSDAFAAQNPVYF